MPDVAIPMQHGLLKRISAFQSKEVSVLGVAGWKPRLLWLVDLIESQTRLSCTRLCLC